MLVLFNVKKSCNEINLIKKIGNSLILRDDLIKIDNDSVNIKENFITLIIILKICLKLKKSLIKENFDNNDSAVTKKSFITLIIILKEFAC